MKTVPANESWRGWDNHYPLIQQIDANSMAIGVYLRLIPS